jgi:hypothetical protein
MEAVQLGVAGGGANGAALTAITGLVSACRAAAATRISSPVAALGTIKAFNANCSAWPGATVASTRPCCKALNPWRSATLD